MGNNAYGLITGLLNNGGNIALLKHTTNQIISNSTGIQIAAQSNSYNVYLRGKATYVMDWNNANFVPIYASAFSVQSSKQSKTNIIDMTEKEAKKLLDINIVTFDYKYMNAKEQRGVIAEDVYKIIPSVVTMPDNYDENVNYKIDNNNPIEILQQLPSVDYSKFIPYLIKMIQIQQKEIDELKQK